MKRLIALLCLLFAGLPLQAAWLTPGSVPATDWNRSTQTGILLLTCDDWPDSVWMDLADSLDVPITFMCDGSNNEPADSAHVADMREAWEMGLDIGVHTDSQLMLNDGEAETDIAALSAAEVRAMFVANINVLRQTMENRTGGPLGTAWTPQAWAYYGNNWTEAALAIGAEYFTWQRGRYYGNDTPAATMYSPLMSSAAADYTGFTLNTVTNTPWASYSGRGVPIVQANAHRMPFLFACNKCDSLTSGTAATDTLGMGRFLLDTASKRLISVVNLHPGGSDMDYNELHMLMKAAKARGDIWITTPRKLMANTTLAAALNRALDDTLYTSASAGLGGLGTWADPAHVMVALNENWTHPVKAKTDEVYFLDTLGVQTLDLQPAGAISFSGPATIKMYLRDTGGSADPEDASTAYLKASPRASTYDDDPGHASAYTNQNPQVFHNLTFLSFGNTSYSSSPAAGVIVSGKGVTFEDCAFTIRSKFGIKAITGGARLRLINNVFTVDTTIAGCGAVTTLHASDSMFVAIGNTFKSGLTSNANTLLYFEVKPTAAKADTIANNIFWNVGSNSTSNAVRYGAATSATKPYYNVYWGGNLNRSAAGQPLKIQLKAGAVTWAVGNDSLMDYRITLHAATSDSLRSWAVTYDPSARDTVRWGGIALGTRYGTASRWGSIGSTQYLGDPIVWSGNYTGRETYQDMSPWKLLGLINSGVLPTVTAADVSTYYEIPRVYDESSATMVETWLDAWRLWPSATRAKIQYKFSDTTALIRSADSSYVGPAQLMASLVGGNETACDSTNSATWFIYTRPYNLTDKLQIRHWMDYMETQAEATRKLYRFKVADTDLGFYSPATGETYGGLWALDAAIGATTEAASDSLNPANWFQLPRERPNAYAQGVQNRIYTRALAVWPDAKRKRVRVTTK